MHACCSSSNRSGQARIMTQRTRRWSVVRQLCLWAEPARTAHWVVIDCWLHKCICTLASLASSVVGIFAAAPGWKLDPKKTIISHQAARCRGFGGSATSGGTPLGSPDAPAGGGRSSAAPANFAAGGGAATFASPGLLVGGLCHCCVCSCIGLPMTAFAARGSCCSGCGSDPAVPASPAGCSGSGSGLATSSDDAVFGVRPAGGGGGCNSCCFGAARKTAAAGCCGASPGLEASGTLFCCRGTGCGLATGSAAAGCGGCSCALAARGMAARCSPLLDPGGGLPAALPPLGRAAGGGTGRVPWPAAPSAPAGGRAAQSGDGGRPTVLLRPKYTGGGGRWELLGGRGCTARGGGGCGPLPPLLVPVPVLRPLSKPDAVTSREAAPAPGARGLGGAEPGTASRPDAAGDGGGG